MQQQRTLDMVVVLVVLETTTKVLPQVVLGLVEIALVQVLPTQVAVVVVGQTMVLLLLLAVRVLLESVIYQILLLRQQLLAHQHIFLAVDTIFILGLVQGVLLSNGTFCSNH
jgi:hypothetical protein